MQYPEKPLVDPRKSRTTEIHKLAKRGLRIGRTRVGRGVFATKRIVDGSCVGEISGRVISDDEYVSRYSFDLNDGTQLEPEYPFRFVNHSCEPNCAFETFLFPSKPTHASTKSHFEQGTAAPHYRSQPRGRADENTSPQTATFRKLLLFAICDIAIGQELTIDYCWPASFAIPCHCQAPLCRGWIVAPKELAQLIDPPVMNLP
jgi:hypothetical protein